jgi:hypothetical protein
VALVGIRPTAPPVPAATRTPTHCALNGPPTEIPAEPSATPATPAPAAR